MAKKQRGRGGGKKRSSSRKDRGAEPQTPKLQLSGTLVRPPSLAEGIENCLANPFYEVRLCMQLSAHLREWPGSDVAWPDRFLHDLKISLDMAWLRLGTVSRNLSRHHRHELCMAERIQARVVMRELGEWIMETLIRRSVPRAAESAELPIVVPQDIRDRVLALAKLGRVIAMGWIELELERDVIAKTRGTRHVPDLEDAVDPGGRIVAVALDASSEQPEIGPGTPLTAGAGGGLVPALAQQPPADAPAPQPPEFSLDDIGRLGSEPGRWVPIRVVVDLERLTSATLNNYRSSGIKNADRSAGSDAAGRIWRKRGPNAQVEYLRSSLRSVKDGLGKPSQ